MIWGGMECGKFLLSHKEQNINLHGRMSISSGFVDMQTQRAARYILV